MAKDKKKPPLDTVQRWLQAVITHPSGIASGVGSDAAQREIPVSRDEIEQLIGRSQQLSSIERLAIYGTSYYLRLVECLREMLPYLCETVGELAFNSLAMGYLQKYPPTSHTLAELGKKLPEYLDETRPLETSAETSLDPDWSRFVVELARLELAINEVFDGRGMERGTPLAGEALASIAPEDWPGARLTPSPALRLLAFDFAVNDYYSAMRERELRKEAAEDAAVPGDDELDIALPEKRPTFLAISRRDFVVHRFPLSRTQHALLAALVHGATVGDSIAEAVENAEGSDDELAPQLFTWFRAWADEQFFQGVNA